MKRVKPGDRPPVFTTCVTRGALSRAQTAEHTDQTGYIKSDELEQNGSARQVTSMSAPQLHFLYFTNCSLGTFPPFAPQRANIWLVCETNLLRNGSELLAVMVRASWAIGEDTGFVLPS